MTPQNGSPISRVVVVGAESSGTRLMARILDATGINTLHRSFPYGGSHLRHWPEVSVNEHDADAIVWMQRDWWATVRSQLAASHVKTIKEAWDNIAEAQIRIAEVVRAYSFVVVSYESLVQRPATVIDHVCRWLEVETPVLDEEIVDGNDKYLGVGV